MAAVNLRYPLLDTYVGLMGSTLRLEMEVIHHILAVINTSISYLIQLVIQILMRSLLSVVM